MTCPNVPAAWLDEEVRTSLKNLGMGFIDEAKVQSIFKSYSARFPKLSAEQRIIALMGTYCRDAARMWPNKTSVIRQQLDFAYALGMADLPDKMQGPDANP